MPCDVGDKEDAMGSEHEIRAKSDADETLLVPAEQDALERAAARVATVFQPGVWSPLERTQVLLTWARVIEEHILARMSARAPEPTTSPKVFEPPPVYDHAKGEIRWPDGTVAKVMASDVPRDAADGERIRDMVELAGERDAADLECKRLEVDLAQAQKERDSYKRNAACAEEEIRQLRRNLSKATKRIEELDAFRVEVLKATMGVA